jgi:hypothetical protein
MALGWNVRFGNNIIGSFDEESSPEKYKNIPVKQMPK